MRMRMKMRMRLMTNKTMKVTIMKEIKVHQVKRVIIDKFAYKNNYFMLHARLYINCIYSLYCVHLTNLVRASRLLNNI